MSSSSNSIGNYFDAARNFLNTWVKVMETTLGSNADAAPILKGAENYADMANGFLTNLENLAKKQAEYIDTLTPEQYQKESLEALREYRKAFDEASQKVDEMLSQEEEYIQSDKFLNDTKESASRATQFYNAWLDGFSNLLNTYTKSMEEVVK